jgi:hypothetical protein
VAQPEQFAFSPSLCSVDSENLKIFAGYLRCVIELNGSFGFVACQAARIYENAAGKRPRDSPHVHQFSPPANVLFNADNCDACHRLQTGDGKARRSVRADGSRKRLLAEACLFTDVPLKRELSKSKESIRVLHWANSPNQNYTARQVALRSAEELG